MNTPSKPPLRTAMIFKREGKRANQGRWLEAGIARVEPNGAINIYVDRLPVGGWSGHVHILAEGGQPPDLKPTRPGEDHNDDIDAEDA